MKGESPGAVLAVNIRRGRGVRVLSQADLAERMVALGFGWVRQTVSEVERCRRAVTVSELVALAMALSTSVLSLLDPVTCDWGIHYQRWDGNTPSETLL